MLPALSLSERRFSRRVTAFGVVALVGMQMVVTRTVGQTVDPAAIARERGLASFRAARDTFLRAGTATTPDPVPAIYFPAQLSEEDFARIAFFATDQRLACDVLRAQLVELNDRDLERRRASLPAFWESVAAPPSSDPEERLRAVRRDRDRWTAVRKALLEQESTALRELLGAVAEPAAVDEVVLVVGELRRADPRRVQYTMTPGANASPVHFTHRWLVERVSDESSKGAARDAMRAHVPILAELYDRWDSQKSRVITAEAETAIRLDHGAAAGEDGREQRRAAFRHREAALRAVAATERAIVAEAQALVRSVADCMPKDEATELLMAFAIETFGTIAIDPFDAAFLSTRVEGSNAPSSGETDAWLSPASWSERSESSSALAVSSAMRAFDRFWSRYAQRYLTNAAEQAELLDGIRRAYADARSRSESLLRECAAARELSAEATEPWIAACLREGDRRATSTVDAIQRRLPPVPSERAPGPKPPEEAASAGENDR